ncbi:MULTISPECIES: OprD family outer membrane porin [unclassified Paraflavitalea]|uniref:OprD family outer membrane porin n=1 Tax=unclassified Paraflavitalea TaxID=2798305 RepID=UPI003D35545C
MYFIRKLVSTGALLFIALCSHAQHQELNEHPKTWNGEKTLSQDTTSFLSAFSRGKFTGHFRYFYMNTNNEKGLSDYHAQAAGGGLQYHTALFHGFQFGVSGFFVFNVGSSNLTIPDSSTKQLNRYEIGLYDITDPSNTKNIDRLEELFIRYSKYNITLTVGRQLMNTPFINLQDGRMRPTEIEGVDGIYKKKKTKIEAAYIYQLSPRSTVEWYNIGESIGLYPSGVNQDGTKSQYKGNLESKGILLGGISQEVGKEIKLQLWNQFTENIFNSVFFQADYSRVLKNKSKLIAGFQTIHQQIIHHGGNEDPTKTYFQKGASSHTYGAKFGWENKRWQFSANYNRITKHGRYLMPREWGRDPFFTFLPRERNEGLGNVHAYVVKGGYAIPKQPLKIQAAWGYYQLPDPTNFELNKYGMPSYSQLNIDLRYELQGFFKGWDLQVLYVNKESQGHTHNNNKYVINKVNMDQWNLVLNFHY